MKPPPATADTQNMVLTEWSPEWRKSGRGGNFWRIEARPRPPSCQPYAVARHGVSGGSSEVRRYEGTRVRDYESTRVREYESTRVREYGTCGRADVRDPALSLHPRQRARVAGTLAGG